MTVDFSSLEQQFGLPPGLLSAVQQQESGGNPNAVSPAGALGAFQFMPATAKQYGIDPTDPDQSAAGAAQMYSDLLDKYKGDVPSALAAYNWGQGNLDKQGLPNAPAETKNYISSIMSKIGNAIVPSAQAAESNPYTSLSDDQLLAEAQKQGIVPAQQGYESDIGASSQVPASEKVTSDNDERKSDVASDVAREDQPNPYASIPDDQLIAEGKKQGLIESEEDTKTTMGSKHKEMLGNAEVAMGPQGTGFGLPATMTGYAANAIHRFLPGVSEAGSALAALAGAGQGNSFGERYNNLEQSQQAMREAGKSNSPIGTAIGEVGSTLASAPLLPGAGESGSYLSAIAKNAGLGGLTGAAYGFGDTNSFLPDQQAADQRAENMGSGAKSGALAGGIFGGAAHAISPATDAITTSQGAKDAAKVFYDLADQKGGVIDNPNSLMDMFKGKDPVTPTEIAVAKNDPVRKFAADFADVRNAPMTLSDAQILDEELSNRIGKEYGIGGLSKDGQKLLDAQSNFRNALATAPPETVGGGTEGYEAWKNGQKAWQQAMKLQDLERIQTRADLADNPATMIKSGIRTLLSNPARVRGYSPQEIKALQQAADRGVIGNAAYVFGSRLLPMGATIAGEAVGGIPGAIIGGVIGHGGTSLVRGIGTSIQKNKLSNAAATLGKGVPRQ